MKKIVRKFNVVKINSNVRMDSASISLGVVVNFSINFVHLFMIENIDQNHIYFFFMRKDGEIDCSTDHSDEDDCHTNSTSTLCKPNYFQCADGKSCIPATWQW